MKARWLLVSLMLLGLLLALVAGLSFAQGVASGIAQGGAPTVVSYQGQVTVSGSPFDGTGYFKFAVVNAAGNTSYWSNDGTSAGGGLPTAAVQLDVADGLFSVLLGDNTLSGMTQALTAAVFSEPDRYLRVWFSADGSAFDLLRPDTRIAAVPYALQAQEAVNADTLDGQHASGFAAATHSHAPGDITPQGAGSGLDADTVDGLHASELGGTVYQNVVVVAKSGGHYTSVQEAITNITDAAADNAYLVWVAPGVYVEQVTMKPHVHLQGAGQGATVISSTVSSAWPPTQGTLLLARDTSLRDLTVGNSGTGDVNTALLATAGMTRTLVADVTARALGAGVANMAIVLSGSGTGVTLQQVSALAENGSSSGIGLANMSGAAAVLRGGAFTGRGGEGNAYGIYNRDSGSTLEAVDVTALGENGDNLNAGMSNYSYAAAVVHGGVFTGRGGNQAGGLGNNFTSTMTAEDVTTLAEDGTENYSLGSYRGSTMTVRGANVTARGGEGNYALSNEDNVTMDAESVTALAENGTSANYGMWNADNADAKVRGGSFTGRGGPKAWGIYSHNSGTTLEAEGVTALGENASEETYGLNNSDTAEAMLFGGSFTARGGMTATAIYNSDSSTTLAAESVTALAEDGGANIGAVNDNSAAATLRGGSFTGYAGTLAFGIVNWHNTTMEVERVTALAEGGTSMSVGMTNAFGAAATVRGGSFTGRGGDVATGIDDSGNVGVLEVERASALGENGTNSRGLRSTGTTTVTLSVLEGATASVQHGGSLTTTVSQSRLVGGAASGAVYCVDVSRGSSWFALGCP